MAYPVSRFFYVIVLLFCTSGNAAVGKATVKLSQIESYLNNLTTLQARFKQWDPNGTPTTGLLYLQRPGHLRMTYDKPSTFVIIADGETLFFADRKTGDLSYTPIQQSPASFLLAADMNLQRGFHVDEFSVKGNTIKLTIRRQGDQDLGALSLVFQRSPSLQLVQWIIMDAQGKKTIVNLEHVQVGHALNQALFDASSLMSKRS